MRRRPYRAWTPADDALLLMLDDVASATQTAVALGRSRREIVRRHAYLRAVEGHGPEERRPWTEADDAELARLHVARVLVLEAAPRLRWTAAAVRARAKGLGLRRRGRKPSRRLS